MYNMCIVLFPDYGIRILSISSFLYQLRHAQWLEIWQSCVTIFPPIKYISHDTWHGDIIFCEQRFVDNNCASYIKEVTTKFS